ncbi:MAG: phospholipase/lecithinase/hemolysin [Verrucomicrobiaceae bacterium]|nr:phospholipase/lecithinase/hemolysin [Verrucomicrobiaceae bacterium]
MKAYDKNMKNVLLVAFVALGLFNASAQAGQHCLVIGDSLSKEYEVEFPALYPSNPDSWKARNWIEILAEQRNAWFDIGHFQAFYDPRLVGHEFDWAFPGAKTQEIRDRLYSKSWFDQIWQNSLRSELKSSVNRVVIFAGGNDVSGYYGDIYNGKSPTLLINKTRDNLMAIVDYVRAVRPSLQIVLVAVPHPGCSPHIQDSYPTNTVKTARVTTALNSLNTQLAALTKSRAVGFAGNVYEFTKSMITGKFIIGGVEIARKADADARPTYAYSGDGYHPGTSAQSRVAQIILDTFRTKWPSPAIPPLTDAEVLSKVLKIQ